MLDPIKLWGDLARIGLESQMVIGLRTAGMIGLVDCPKNETIRMITEKQDAALSAMRGATRAAMLGQAPDKIINAAIRPYGHRTHSNAKRLMRAALD